MFAAANTSLYFSSGWFGSFKQMRTRIPDADMDNSSRNNNNKDMDTYMNMYMTLEFSHFESGFYAEM